LTINDIIRVKQLVKNVKRMIKPAGKSFMVDVFTHLSKGDQTVLESLKTK